MIRAVLAAAIATVAVTIAAAQQDPIAARKDLMSENGRDFYGVLGRMQRGQTPYDQARVDAALKTLADSAPKIAPLFPDSSRPTTPSKDYDASPKIWDSKADFDAKAADYVKAAADSVGKATDLASLKVVYQALGKTCDACHELYRVKH